MGNARKLICIAAPPRSGNVLLAQAARAAGVHLGRDKECCPSLANLHGPGGSCEHAVVEQAHRETLARLDRTWFQTSPPPREWWRDPAFLTDTERLAALASGPLWGWKSPMGTLMLPLWEPVAAATGSEMRVVIPLRNPLATAASLVRIARLPLRQGLRLWTSQMLSVLDQAQAHPHRLFDYDRFIAKPQPQARRLLEFLGLEATPDRLAKVAATARPELRHLPPASLGELRRVAGDEVTALYQQCLALAEDAVAANPPHRLQSLEAYRSVAELMDFDVGDRQPAWIIARLFRDTGAGFVAGEAEARLIPLAANGAFRETYDLRIPGLRRLAFSPANGLAFRSRLESLETPSQILIHCRGNPAERADGWDLFPPSRSLPLYEMEADFSKTGQITIAGRIELQSMPPVRSQHQGGVAK
jgi:hypothetical protein